MAINQPSKYKWAADKMWLHSTITGCALSLKSGLHWLAQTFILHKHTKNLSSEIHNLQYTIYQRQLQLCSFETLFLLLSR